MNILHILPNRPFEEQINGVWTRTRTPDDAGVTIDVVDAQRRNYTDTTGFAMSGHIGTRLDTGAPIRACWSVVGLCAWEEEDA